MVFEKKYNNLKKQLLNMTFLKLFPNLLHFLRNQLKLSFEKITLIEF